jgi:hypothetical protein
MQDNGDNEDIRDYRLYWIGPRAWATQDPEDRQDYTEPRRQMGLLVQRSRVQTGLNKKTRTHGIMQDTQERQDNGTRQDQKTCSI